MLHVVPTAIATRGVVNVYRRSSGYNIVSSGLSCADITCQSWSRSSPNRPASTLICYAKSECLRKCFTRYFVIIIIIISSSSSSSTGGDQMFGLRTHRGSRTMLQPQVYCASISYVIAFTFCSFTCIFDSKLVKILNDVGPK